MVGNFAKLSSFTNNIEALSFRKVSKFFNIKTINDDLLIINKEAAQAAIKCSNGLITL